MNLANLVSASAAATPEAVAVQMHGSSFTYREFLEEGARVSAGLAGLGVGPGDRVMMFAENCVEYLVVYHATVRLGAVFVPVHASFQASELTYVLTNAQPAAVVAHEHLWGRLDKFSDGLPTVRVSLGPTGRSDLIEYKSLGVGSSPRPILDVVPEHPALVCYTSGSSSRPLPVSRSHSTEIFNATTYARVWDYRAGDRALVALPLSWVYGLTTLSQGLLSVGATILLHNDFAVDAVIDEVQSSQVTLLAGTTSMYVRLLEGVQSRQADFTSLRHLYSGGEPSAPSIVTALEQSVGLGLTEAYACTEVAPVLAVDPLRDLDAPLGTAGRLVEGAQLRLVDDEGFDVPIGAIGEAWLAGEGLMINYWNEPGLTRERLTPDGWFRSGDLLRQTEDGYYFVVGRTSEIIIRNGARIAPAEIEAALTSLPGVAHAAAVGVPDPDFGESIVAFVVSEPSCVVSEDDVYVYLSDRIARFKLPSEIIFVDALPVGRNEKRDRLALKLRALETIAGAQ